MNAYLATTQPPVFLTPKKETKGVTVKLKVFWKTTQFWTPANINDFQIRAPSIAERLLSGKYTDVKGDTHHYEFTCEDFAIRVLCEYAAPRGLPVKLRTGADTYRNMEQYKPEKHNRYPSNFQGFSEMVMTTYAAVDMLQNTKKMSGIKKLRPGDILLQNDNGHVQVVVSVMPAKIEVIQGNFPEYKAETFIRKAIGRAMKPFRHANPAQDPGNHVYLGQRPQRGIYILEKNGGWKYKNITLNTDYEFETPTKMMGKCLRWNFEQFSS